MTSKNEDKKTKKEKLGKEKVKKKEIEKEKVGDKWPEKEKPKKDERKEVKKTEKEIIEKPREKRKEKEERIAILNIYTTFNNTIMTLTDFSGRSIAKFSGGGSTKQSRLKANPTIAMFVAQKIAEESKDNGITGFYVKIRAATGQSNPGPCAHAAIKSLTRAGFKIKSIMDTTKIPRGGPKKKGGRRGRRP